MHVRKKRPSKLRWIQGLVAIAPSLFLIQPVSAQDMVSKLCATRVSFAITGQAPNASLLNETNPRDSKILDELLASDAFKERFARFANSQFNEGPGEKSAEDATYHMVKHVLDNDLKWEEVFVGRYNVVSENRNVRVVEDPNGLGYTRSEAWKARYAGNEGDGVRINTAYRVMQNTFGLELVAANLPADADTTADGRTDMPCASCHFDATAALDPVAEAFPNVRRDRNGQITGYARPNSEPTQMLGGNVITTDGELMRLLVDSVDHQYHVCELAYKYLTGCHEDKCDNLQMAACLAAFRDTGKLKDAVKTLVSDELFCKS